MRPFVFVDNDLRLYAGISAVDGNCLTGDIAGFLSTEEDGDGVEFAFAAVGLLA